MKARASLRRGSLQLKLFQSLSKFTFEDEVDSNDYIRVTSQTLHKTGENNIKLLTFPHNPVAQGSGVFEKAATSLRGRPVLFEWDPCKFLAITRGICAQVMSTKAHAPFPVALQRNLYSLVDVQEAMVDADSLAQLLEEEVAAGAADVPLLAKSIAKKLLNDNEAAASNANVFSFWLYLLLGAPEGASPRLAFAGIPHPLLYAKLAEHTEKEQIALSFIRWTKFLAERVRDGGQRSIAGLFRAKDMIKFQLLLDARYVRCNYTFEYAKALAAQRGEDVCIVADPLARQAFLQLAKLKQVYAEFPVSAADDLKFTAAQEEYLKSMQDVVSPESHAAMAEETEQKRRLGMPLTESQSDIFRQNFAEFVKLRDWEGQPAEQIDDMLFKMALWDVLLDSKMLESPHVPSKFYFISQSERFLTAERRDEFERKFYVCYRSIQKLKESLVESIARWERPMTVEEALRGLQTQTKLVFEEMDYYAQEDDSAHRAMVEGMTA